MSMWYAELVPLILNVTVLPRFTLIEVAKPWSVLSPEPLTSQSLSGSPVCVFSHAMTLATGGPHGFPAAADRVAGSAAASAMAMPATTTSRHPRFLIWLTDVGRRSTESSPAVKSRLVQP